MEKMTLIYCSIIGLIIVSMFCALLFSSEKTTDTSESLSATDKWLAAGTVLLVLLILHLNWLTLPAELNKDLAMFASVAFCVAGLLLLLFLVAVFRHKANQSEGKLIKWRTTEGAMMKWRVYSSQDRLSEALHPGPNDKMAG